MARLTDDEYEAKRYTNVTQKQYTTSQNWAANYYAKYYQPKQTQQQYFKQRDSQQDSDRMAELARRAREAAAAAEKRRKEAEALRKRQEMSEKQRQSIINYYSNYNDKRNLSGWFQDARNEVRNVLGYPQLANYGAGGTKYYNNYDPERAAAQRAQQAAAAQSALAFTNRLGGSQGYKNSQTEYIGTYRLPRVPLQRGMPMSDIFSTPLGQPTYTYTPVLPANADPWGHDPNEDGGSPYFQQTPQQVPPTFDFDYGGYDDWADYGGGGGYYGGGGGAYSSAPGYYGQNTGDRGRWYQNLLQWNI